MADVDKQMQELFGDQPQPVTEGVPQTSPLIGNTPIDLSDDTPEETDPHPEYPQWMRDWRGAYMDASKIGQGEGYSLSEDIGNMPAHALIGAAKGIEGIINFGKWATGNSDSETHYTSYMFPPATTAEGLAQGGGELLLPMGTVMKGLGAARGLLTGIKDVSELPWLMGKVTSATEGAVAGLVTGEIVADPNDPTLANMIDKDSTGTLSKLVREYLATDPNDSEADNRFRQALFNAGFGAAVDSIVTMVQAGFRAMKPAIRTSNAGFLNPAQEAELEIARNKFNWNLDDYSMPKVRQGAGDILRDIWRKSVQNVFDEAKGAQYLDKDTKDLLGDFHSYEILSMSDHTGQMADLFMQRGPLEKETFRIERIPGSREYRVIGSRSGPLTTTYPRKEAASIAADRYNATGSYAVTGRPGMSTILEPIYGEGHQENFFMYMTGLRAKMLKDKGVDVPFTDDEIDAMIANGHNQNGPVTFTYKNQQYTYDQVMAQMWVFNQDLLDFAVQHGVLSKDMATKLADNGPFVPFYRIFEDTKTQVPGRGIITGADANAFKKIYGSKEYQLEHPLISLMNNVATIVQQSMNNSARRAIYDQIDHLIKIGRTDLAYKYAEPVSNPAVPFNVKQEDVAKALDNAGVTVDLNTVNPDDWMTFFNRGRMKLGSSTDVVYRDGKAYVYELNDPLLAKSMAMLGPNLALRLPDIVIREGSRFKNILTQGVTLAPAFVVRNAVRDSVTGATLTRSGLNWSPFEALGRMTRDRFQYDPQYTEYLANGGGYNMFFGDTSRETYDRFMQYYTTRGFNPSQINPVETLWDTWSNFVGRVETAPRFGEYLGQVQKGVNPRLAAFDSRNITTDFSKEGSTPVFKWLNRNVPFLRAGLAGMYRVGTLATKDPQLLAMRVTATLIPTTLTLWAMNHDDPRYTNLPDYIRDTNWVILPDKIPGYETFFPPEYLDGLNKNTKYPGVILIPKPYELGGITSIAERGLDHIFKQAPGFEFQPQGGGEFLGEMQNIFANAFHLSVLPQSVAPLWDVYVTNQNFTGGPIEPDKLKERKPELRVDEYTSPSMVNVGQNLGISPIQLEYLFKGYTGTLGAAILDWADKHVAWDQKTRGQPPERRWDEMPVLDVFTKNDPLKATQNQIDFYNIFQKVQMENKSYTAVKNAESKNIGNISTAEYLKNPSNLFLGAVPAEFFDNINKINGVYSEQIRLAMTNPKLSSEQKRIEMDKWREKRDQLFETAMNKIKQDPTFKPLLRFKFSPFNIGRYAMPTDMPDLRKATPQTDLNTLLGTEE